MDCTSLETGGMVCDFCDCLRIHNRNPGKQSDALECMDYTDQPFQIMGQICLPFTIIFSGLCAVGILLSGYLLHFLYGEKMPGFHVL